MSGKILVVEDYKNIREMLDILLTFRGFDVVAAVDGYDAIEKALAFSPDLILTDLHMPKLDGIEMTKQLRQIPDYKDTPIVVLSADRYKEREALDAGATRFLKKSVAFDLIISVITELLT